VPLLAGIGPLGLPELAILLVIVVLIFGVGRLPEVGGAVGKSIREFRKATKDGDEDQPEQAMNAAADVHVAATNGTNGATNITSPAPASTTMFCGECGAKNARSAKFCAECGHALSTPVA
jgi:sec-independent protein translocase protein TatA